MKLVCACQQTCMWQNCVLNLLFMVMFLLVVAGLCWRGSLALLSSLDTTNIYWQGQAYFRRVVKTIHACSLDLGPFTWKILSCPRAKSTGNNRILWWFILCVNCTGLRARPGGSGGKEYACNTGDQRRSPGEGNGYPLQYSCLENSMDRGAWWATVHGDTKRHQWATNTFKGLPESWWNIISGCVCTVISRRDLNLNQ